MVNWVDVKTTKITVVVMAVILSACQMTPVNPPETPAEVPAEPVDQAIVEEPPAAESAPVAECPEPVVIEPTPCPAPPPARVVYRPGPVAKAANVVSVDEKLIVGRVENVGVGPENIVVKARIDTGAGLSSLNALDMQPFERDGKAWVRFAILDPAKKDQKVFFERKVKRYKSIKQLGAPAQQRPVVVMTLNLGTVVEKVDVTLVDRTGYLYQLLVGRNFLRDRALVDVSKKFVTEPQSKPIAPVVDQ